MLRYLKLNLTRNEVRVFWGTSFGWAMDAFDYLVYTLVIVYIMQTFHITAGQAGLVGSVSLLTSALGGILAGTLADRFGRVRMLSATIVVYSVFTALSGLAGSFEQLLLFRALEGLGFGGEWAVGAVLLAETISPEKRGKVGGFVQGSWAYGWALAVLLSVIFLRWLPPDLGWRAMFICGIVPAFFVLYVRRFVPEPPIWVHSSDKSKKELLL